MSKFCTACGHPLAPECAFCEECGKPVAPPAKPIARQAQPISAAWSQARIVKFGSAILVALLICGTGLYFLFREAPLPSNAAMAGLINENRTLNQRLTCLQNFDYDKTPVNIASHDVNTRRLMDLLVNAGLYTGPERLTQNRGFFFEELYRYEHTEAIKASLKGKMLCFASGIKVSRIDYEPIARSGKLPQVRGKIYYAYADQASWSLAEEAREMFPERLSIDEQRHLDAHLHLKDGKWLLGPAAASPLADRNSISRQAATKSESSFLDDLGALFSANPANEIFGAWSFRDAVLLEFSAKTVVINGETGAATYRKDGKTIIVTVDGEALRIEPLGKDTLRVSGLGGGESQVVFHRVK